MTEEILEVAPVAQEEPKQRPCAFVNCPDTTRGGMMCNNLTDAQSFPLMGEDESMHLECYIHQCVGKSFDVLVESREL